MNIGYIFDLDKLIKGEAINLPYVSDLCYKQFNSEEFTLHNVIKFRDEVMNGNGGKAVDKHVFFIVIKNNKETIETVSACLSEMQKDRIHFSQQRYEVHVLLNLVDDNGASIKWYENKMPCLKDNSVCVYTWLLDKYDYCGGIPIVEERRSHAIVRFAYIASKYRLSLRQVNNDMSPIYTLFGDSSTFFNEEERDESVRYYYFYKSLQHLLNLSDQALDDYLNDQILPYKDDKVEMDKRLDSSSTSFLHDQRTVLEGSSITEQTQGLLLKSSDDDGDYLVNAADNNLVFIEDLSRKQEWQMKDTANFVNEFWTRISTGEVHQDTITDEFIREIQDKVVVHKRTVFDKVNNEVSLSRRKQVNDFKGKVDSRLLKFLNGNDSYNYSDLSKNLTPQDVKTHHSNIDCGIAFLSYLESGNVDYLSDMEVSSGDIDLFKIKESLIREESSRKTALNLMEEEIEKNYRQGSGGACSEVKAKFEAIDKDIDRHNKNIRLLTFQLDNWIDGDATRKLTARTRALISVIIGIFISGLWTFIYSRWISKVVSFDQYSRWIQWGALLFGFVFAFLILWDVISKRHEEGQSLRKAKDKKKRFMLDCMDKMEELIEKRYLHMLSFHGLKTINELIDYVRSKREDLISFRKTLFRRLVNYRLTSMVQAEPFPSDSNTIELNDIDAGDLLFGEDEQRKVPFCFYNMNGMTLAETFEDYKKKKVRFETTRFAPDFKPQEDFNPEAIEKEIIPCKEEHIAENVQYTALESTSVLPDTKGVEMDDVHQGQCGDCYFMATLASIAQVNPEYIVGKRGMIEPLGSDNRFFRVKFYDKEGNRINVDIDNKFWNKGGRPIYAGIGNNKTSDSSIYDPWVMAVEKAWAKVNNGGYDNIEGASGDGQERVRMVEYSYAVTGKSAFYCMTKNVPDRNRLQEMIKKHFLQDKLPITLYSASPTDSSFSNKDAYLVESHAYSLKSVNDDGTFDIFNPWNNYMADEDVRGKHYEKVSIDFIKDNFDVVVFFGIKEADFLSFERELTGNASEMDLALKIEELMDNSLEHLNCSVQKLEELMTNEVLDKMYNHSSYLCNSARLKDARGVDQNSMNVVYIEPANGCVEANKKLETFLKEEKGESHLTVLSNRNEDKQSLTILRVSPHYVLKDFYDTEE